MYANRCTTSGPRGLPFLGYTPLVRQLDPRYVYKGLMRLAEVYGPVTGFYHGVTATPVVSVCGYRAVKEALANDDLAGRFRSNGDIPAGTLTHNICSLSIFFSNLNPCSI